jgi:hypothetical protein
MSTCSTWFEADYIRIFTQPEKTFFFVFKKLDRTYYWPSFPRYTQKDIDDEAAKLVALPVTDKLVFGDIEQKSSWGFGQC